MKWRVIEMEAYDACMNMAIEEAAWEGIKNGTSPPTIRFYSYKPRAVSIGCFQSIRDEVNLEVCRELGVDIVRRWTGGGAVYHDREITYGVIAPLNIFPRNIIESYRLICGWMVKALENLGIEAEFRPINDILVGNKKISGSAQTRRGGVLLQHGTLLYDLDLKTMFSVLNVSEEKISDKMIKSAEERVTCVQMHTDAGKMEVYEALVGAFTEGREFEFGGWSKDELARAKELAEGKYRSDEWMYLR